MNGNVFSKNPGTSSYFSLLNLDSPLTSKLRSDGKNHSSVLEYPEDIRVYLTEEKQHNAVISPFKHSPIPDIHVSPFMSRDKPNTPNRRLIIDLALPKGYSVNTGVNKNSYLGSEFVLTFPTVDDIMKEVTCLGPGAHLYIIDVSWALRHLNIDPCDYDLLGFYWDSVYVDTCLPFGSRHGSQIFKASAMCYVMQCVAKVFLSLTI